MEDLFEDVKCLMADLVTDLKGLQFGRFIIRFRVSNGRYIKRRMEYIMEDILEDVECIMEDILDDKNTFEYKMEYIFTKYK